jgi:hypothetical protein
MQPTTVATINFKGGVGKTTVTWCLANVAAATANYPTLLFGLILRHLKLRIEPFPVPTIGVFMNKAGYRTNTGLFRETRLYMDRCRAVCEESQKDGFNVHWLENYVPDRVDVKRAIHFGGWAQQYTSDFVNLFKAIEKIV